MTHPQSLMTRRKPQGLRSVVLWMAACLTTAGCASDPLSIPTGTPAEVVSAQMGPPSSVRPTPAGGKQLEYSGGTFGIETYLIELDPGGNVVHASQARQESAFAQVRRGMSPSDVEALLGRPSETFQVGWHERQTVWAYRYRSPFCQWFQVGMDRQGAVVDTAYGPDPLCDPHEQ